tara:strand:- start:621 stop:1016 length:396 start_codon:yes stop_codon:yes gene_type:complete
MSKKLEIAIKCGIQENLHDYIQFGEFDPSLSALKSIAHKINTYSDSSSVYEAIDGDPVISRNLFAIAMEPEYFDETEARLTMQKRLLQQASRALLNYEAFAWQIWEMRNAEPQTPSGPDINVPYRSAHELL